MINSTQKSNGNVYSKVDTLKSDSNLNTLPIMLQSLKKRDRRHERIQAVCCLDLWRVTDYIHNPVYQELIEETDYFGNNSDERVYLDLRVSAGYTNVIEKLERNNSKITLYITVTSAATKKLRLRIWGYSLYTSQHQMV